jgi:hypothetical protein
VPLELGKAGGFGPGAGYGPPPEKLGELLSSFDQDLQVQGGQALQPMHYPLMCIWRALNAADNEGVDCFAAGPARSDVLRMRHRDQPKEWASVRESASRIHLAITEGSSAEREPIHIPPSSRGSAKRSVITDCFSAKPLRSDDPPYRSRESRCVVTLRSGEPQGPKRPRIRSTTTLPDPRPSSIHPSR